MSSFAGYAAGLAGWGIAGVAWQAWWIAAIVRRPAVRDMSDVNDPRGQFNLSLLALLAIAAAFLGSIGAAHLALFQNAALGTSGATALTSRRWSAVGDVMSVVGVALPWVGAVWAGGAVIASVRLVIAARQLQARIARAVDAPERLKLRVTLLARRLTLARVPRVVVTDDGNATPWVAGLRSPTLVVPQAVHTWGDELDALILHELAHLRRKDIAANYVARLLLVLFWFHPALRTLVRSLLEMSEQCCDDEAVRWLSSPVTLARALIRLAEVQTRMPPSSSLGIAALGRDVRSSLVIRIGRLTRMRNGSAPHPHVSRPPSRLPALALASVVCLVGTLKSAVVLSTYDPLVLAGAATGVLPATRLTFQAIDPAGSFSLYFVDGRIALASLGGRPVERSSVQIDGRVVRIDAAGTEPLVIAFDPAGRICWTPRRKVN